MTGGSSLLSSNRQALLLAFFLLGSLFAGLAAGARRQVRVVERVAGRHSASRSASHSDRTSGAAGAASHRAGAASWASSSTTGSACRPDEVLAVTYESSASSEDGKLYGNLMAYGLFQAKPGDYYEYEMMWADPDCNCGAEFEAGGEYRLRDHAGLDANGYSPHSEKNANMSSVVTRRWYKRSWNISSQLNNRFIDKWVFSALLKPGQRRTAYYKYIRLVRPDNGEQQGGAASGSGYVTSTTGNSGKVVWEQGMAPIAINTYYPGSVTTRCQATTFIEASEVALTPKKSRPGAFTRLSFVIRASKLELDAPVPANASMTSTKDDASGSTGGESGSPRDGQGDGHPVVDDTDASDDDDGPQRPPGGTIPRRREQPSCDVRRDLISFLREHTDEHAVERVAKSESHLLGFTARLRHRLVQPITLWDFGRCPQPGTCFATSSDREETGGSAAGGAELTQASDSGATVVFFDRPRPLPMFLSFAFRVPDASPLTHLLAEAVWEVNVTTSTRRGQEGLAYHNTTVFLDPFRGDF